MTDPYNTLDSKCVVEGCDRQKATRQKYCTTHQMRLRRYGDPTVVTFQCIGLPPLERFQLGFSKMETGCWIWDRPCKRSGYGRFKAEGISFRAHRFAYETFVGPIPKDKCVLHRCDNRRCVNPEHLFLGSHADNVADMVSKDRQAKGRRVAGSKLTDVQALEIRNSAEPSEDLARRYGIHKTHVWNIRTGKAWGWL